RENWIACRKRLRIVRGNEVTWSKNHYSPLEPQPHDLPSMEEPRIPEPLGSMPSIGAPLRVLVVEDEPLVREVLSVYLSEDEHIIEVAENGREGLEKFQAGEYDLVLTDRAMPEMNG